MFHLYPPLSTPTITDVIEKNQQFLCEFVDLKRNGFLHYTKALNNYTYFFWSPWLNDADNYVKNLADNLKLTIRMK
jgi:hypothetical protein